MKVICHLWNPETGQFRTDYNSRYKTIAEESHNVWGYFRPTASRKRLRHRVRQARKLYVAERDAAMLEMENNPSTL